MTPPCEKNVAYNITTVTTAIVIVGKNNFKGAKVLEKLSEKLSKLSFEIEMPEKGQSMGAKM